MDTKNWKEFRVGDLFDIESSPSFDMININISNKMNDDYKYEFIIRSKENNGVKGYVEYLGIEPNGKNKITISQIGTIVAQYRNKDYYTSQNVFNLNPKFDLTKNKALFFVSSLNCVLKKYSGYSDYPTLKSLKNEIIELPTKDDKPDFDYMEYFIKNRENVVKEKIENFKNIKERKSKIDTQEWKEFRVDDLFEIKPTKNHGRANKDLFDDFGTTPVVVNSSYDNGIGGMTDLKPTEKAPKITFSDTTNAESIFLQISDFAGYSHIQGLNPIKYESQWNEKTLLYFCTVFKTKALTMSYSYVNKFTRISAESLNIKLPIKNNEPDWDYMEDYIDKKQKEVRKKLELLRR